MNDHPFAEKCFEQAEENIGKLVNILKNGDLDAFMQLVKYEALTLHGMMITSTPYFILMNSKTIEVINELWKYRDKTKILVCFTLDAGANVHILYLEQYAQEVEKCIENTLINFCENGNYILDKVGLGAQIGSIYFYQKT